MAEFRRTVSIVAVLNLIFFFAEVIIANAIGSLSLLADSIDFFEDASVNTLIFFALAWKPKTRAWIARVLALFLLVPAVLGVVNVVNRGLEPEAPSPLPLALMAIAAFVINLFCALLLARHRSDGGSLGNAAWLASRNDALANVAILIGAIISTIVNTGWIDIVIGVGIVIMNADAALVILRSANSEAGNSNPTP